jgi:hypothetical protein
MNICGMVRMILKTRKKQKKKKWVEPRILKEMDIEIRAAFCGHFSKIVRDPPYCVIPYS